MAGMIKRGYMMYIVFAIVGALVAFVGSAVLGCVMGALIYAAYVLIMYAEGSTRGEHACGVRDMIARIEGEGKQVDDKQRREAYNVSSAIKAALWVAVPFVILAVVNLILADPKAASEGTLGVISRIVFLPEAFITRICAETVKYNTEAVQKAGAVIVSALDFDSVNTATLLSGLNGLGTYAFAYDLEPLTIMRILYIPSSMLPAAAMLFGYTRGPKLRAKTVSDMLKGTNKKRKKLKVFGRQHKAHQAKPEI